MGEQQSDEAAEPNAVLRGGPFDGEQIHVTAQARLVRFAGKVRHIYKPTSELDTEYPTLVVFVHEHTLVY